MDSDPASTGWEGRFPRFWPSLAPLSGCVRAELGQSASYTIALTLVVTRIDRLARSMRNLLGIAHDLKKRCVTLRATEQPVDTIVAAGKAFLDMLGSRDKVGRGGSDPIYSACDSLMRQGLQAPRHRNSDASAS